MKHTFKTKLLASCLIAASGGIAYPAFAQSGSATVLEEVIVSARRVDESLQDVPVTVNVVTSEVLEELNIRRFEDLEQVVAGLELEDRAVGPLASMRGIRFDAFASGNNPSVEFYLNDSLITANIAMQSMFDVGKVEVLRGPQGTLRGRASPSGSITMTAKRPNLQEFEGSIDYTSTNEGGENYNGGISIPLIKDKLALRVAGFSEENRINHVESFRTGEEAKMESDGYRVSMLFQPSDNLSINAYFQDLSTDRWQYSQIESANIVDPSLADSPMHIKDSDRLSAQLAPTTNFTDSERAGLELEWDLGPVQFNYSGALTDNSFINEEVADIAGFYDETYPEEVQGVLNQSVANDQTAESHEIRLSGDLTDSLMLTTGVFYSTLDSTNNIESVTPVFSSGTGPNDYCCSVITPIVSAGVSKEISYFGNLIYRLTENTELSGGLRYIDYQNDSSVTVNGTVLGEDHQDEQNVIYTLSLAHNFTPDVMGYVTLGSSWRPGKQDVGNSDTDRTAQEQKFLVTPEEESDSIEFGLKTTSLDGRLRLNATVFYQQFEGYPDLGAGGSVRYVDTDSAGLETVDNDNFLAGLDVDVYGLEFDGSFQITDNWNVSGNYSWAQGTQEGEIACNDYAPADGNPDSSVPPVTVGEIRAATGGDDIASCNISERSYEGPTWSTSLTTEYSHQMFDQMDGYVRLQAKINGASKGNATNPNDNVDSYSTLNLYAGLRSGETEYGRWEVMAFVKNLTDTQERTNFGTNPVITGVRTFLGTSNEVSPYRTVSLTAPREIGLNIRYNF
ncbi:TonB-dependent receptor [Pseudomaricurvus sp.]|uniref:TonB-dependent receptor n=1 Tax=Pseudomaricurvus sp. TaxID=2004510 RepID=UPI003F6D5C7A